MAVVRRLEQLVLEKGSPHTEVQCMYSIVDDTQVSIRTLQQVHTTTHPAATLEHHSAPATLPRIAPQTQPGDPSTEDLFATLDAEAIEEGDKEE